MKKSLFAFLTLGLCLTLFSGCNSSSDDKAIGALIPFLQGSGSSSSTNTSTPTDTSTTTTGGTAVLLGASGKTTYGQGITSDSSGNVYITGYTNGNLDGQTLTGSNDLFVVKYNSQKVKQWTRLLGTTSGTVQAYGIASDSSNNIYVTGQTNRDLGGQTKTGSYDLFLVKYDSSGNIQWTRLLGVASASTEAHGIGIDSSGNIYLAGFTEGALDGQTKTSSSQFTDLFITKYDSSETKQWTRLLGAASSRTEAYAVKTDGSGNIYVAGNTTGNLGGQTLTGTMDAFIYKLDSSGSAQWTKLLGVASSATYSYGLTLDSSGNSFITGQTNGKIDDQTLTGTQDIFLAKYDSSGTKK